jgi:hypothetical protein
MSGNYSLVVVEEEEEEVEVVVVEEGEEVEHPLLVEVEEELYWIEEQAIDVQVAKIVAEFAAGNTIKNSVIANMKTIAHFMKNFGSLAILMSTETSALGQLACFG